MSGDAELDRIMAKKMAAMRRRAREDRPKSPRETVVSVLGHRGVEVLENAERQFPRDTAALIPQIADLVRTGELRALDGGQLLYVFRLAGLDVRMRTSIKVEQDGKMVSLSERLGGS